MVEGFTPGNRSGERILFTPGPLTTSPRVKSEMLIDIGSWDADCVDLTREIREELVGLANSDEDLTCTLMQGSGSFGVEAAIGSAIPADGKILVLRNGAYGQRIEWMARALGIPHVVIEEPEDRPHSADAVGAALQSDPEITHVVCVHCETTTGLLNPLGEIAAVVEQNNRRFIVDAISTFGAYETGPGKPIDFSVGPIDHLVGSANKCIEGVPGFAFVLSRRSAIERCAGSARSLCLDLHDHWKGFETHGKFRYPPPTHVLLAFRQALLELREEGGIAGRARRYRENHDVLVEGLAELGFATFVPEPYRSWIITTFLCPEGFEFWPFYEALHDKGYIIYPGKLTEVDTFRIANIGAIDAEDIRGLVDAIRGIQA